MLTCKGASHLISHRHDRALTRRERWALRLHLWICANCRRFERQMRFMNRVLRELGRRSEAQALELTAAADLPPEARERIRQALADAETRRTDPPA